MNLNTLNGFNLLSDSILRDINEENRKIDKLNLDKEITAKYFIKRNNTKVIEDNTSNDKISSSSEEEKEIKVNKVLVVEPEKKQAEEVKKIALKKNLNLNIERIITALIWYFGIKETSQSFKDERLEHLLHFKYDMLLFKIEESINKSIKKIPPSKYSMRKRVLKK